MEKAETRSEDGAGAFDKSALADALLSSALDCIVVANTAGLIIEFNQAAEQVFGWSRAEALGRTMEDTIIPPQHREAHRKGMARYIAGGAPRVLGRRVELEAQRRDGSIFPVELAITEAMAGKERLFVARIRDITGEKEAAEELDRVRATLQSIFDSVPVELYVRELDGTIVLMNKWGAERLGRTPDDIVGTNIHEFRVPSEIPVARRIQAQLLETGQPISEEMQISYQTGEVRGLTTMFPVRDAQGNITRLGGFIVDVDELHKARVKLQQAQDTLNKSEKMAMLGQLLAGVAHELNNPLAVVLGRAAILQEKLANTPHAAPLTKLREAAERCARIVKTFLAMARQTGPRMSTVQINDLIENALEMTTYGLRKANAELTLDLAPNLPPSEADEDQIVQIVTNLVLNAQHALQTVDTPRRIRITTAFHPAASRITLTVADNGPGVAPEIAHRLFDPFFTTKPVGEGTGLGLSVCRSMAEAHGGTLELAAAGGPGAAFVLTLPVARTDQDAAGSVAASVPRPARGRVLVIDDEPEIAAILADCLAPLGVECVLAANGAQALERLASQGFDAIFCDVSMPVMDGMTFYKRIRSERPDLAQRLAFVSGDVLHRDWDRLKDAFDRPIVEKPFDPKVIREVAQDLLAAREAQP